MTHQNDMNNRILGLKYSTFAAILYIVGTFDLMLQLLLTIYVFMCIDNTTMQKHATKAILVSFGVAVLIQVVNVIPNTFGLLNSFVNLFGGDISIGFLDKLINLCNSILKYAKHILLVIFAISAYTNKAINIPGLDKVEKVLDNETLK